MILKRKLLKATVFSFLLAVSTSCASSGEDEEVEDPMLEEMEQQEADEETMVEEPAMGSSEVSSEEAAEEVVEEGTESLASELDRLAGPEETANEGMADQELASTNMMEEQSAPTPKELPTIDGDVAEYVVQPGDTLGGISSKLYGTPSRWPQLATDNAIDNASVIYPGDVVRYRVNDRANDFKTAYEGVEQEVIMVQEGDSLEVIAERLFGRRDYWKPMWLLNKDQIPNPNLIYSGQIVRYVDPKKVAQMMTEKGFTKMAH